MSNFRPVKKKKDFRDKLDDNLVLWLRFNEGSDTTAYDSSRQFNHGTITDGAYVDGKVGSNALDFNGSSSYVNCGNSSKFDFGTGDLTISVWIKMLVTTGTIYSKELFTTSDKAIWFAINGKTARINLWNGVLEDVAIGTIEINDGEWHHIVGVRSSTKIGIYVDGELDNEENATGVDSDISDDVLIGVEGSDPFGGYFNGSIDDVRVYDRALSATEISQLYTAGGGT